MSAAGKKRVVTNERETESSDSESSDDEFADEECLGNQQEIQVEFEGRNPIDTDFNGIRQLLQQLLLKSHVNASDLTEIIIQQGYVGSVVKQCADSPGDSDEEDGPDTDDVFGVTSVINLTDKEEREGVQQIRTLIVEKSARHATDATNQLFRSVLGDSARPVGLLINERFVNIPAQISVPLLESLSKEIKRAKDRKMPYDFSYYIVVSKLHRIDNKRKKKKKNRNKGGVGGGGGLPQAVEEEMWTNPEEVEFSKASDAWFEFSVQSDSDTGMAGQWTEDDAEMTPYRRVMLIPASKLDSVIDSIKTMLM